MAHAVTGPEYDEAEAVTAMQAAGLEGRRVDDIEERVAELLSQGALVGWFQGRAELGPRALGNRSLLADPRVADVTDRLNRRVKHREPFRPFAPSVLAEHARSWFRIERPTDAAAYMLVAYPATARTRALARAVVHADGTSRVQVVECDQNPRYHRLISAFYRRTGVPIVLNTSFNDSEPIVCSPADAVRTFVETGLDHLAIGDLLVTRRG
jgi:carbamoyltransferase